MSYTKHLPTIAAEDARFLVEKDASYGSSWKKRGGLGAYMMLARKMDRLEQIVQDFPYEMGTAPKPNPYDIFACIVAQPSGHDGSVLAEVRDLRRYLLLVEAEMVERGVVEAPKKILNLQPVDPAKMQGMIGGGGAGSYRPATMDEILARNPPTNRLRRQLNHTELMGLPREDQLRYKFVEGEQAYILQPGKVVSSGEIGKSYFLPEKVGKEKYNSMSYVMKDIELIKYYNFNHSNQTWYLLESDRD